jgi:hypothetical protein
LECEVVQLIQREFFFLFCGLSIRSSDLVRLPLFQLGFQAIAFFVDALPGLLARLFLLLSDSALEILLLLAVLAQ